MMSTQRNENESFQISIQYRILRMVLLVLVVILPAAWILNRIMGPVGVWHGFWISEWISAAVSACLVGRFAFAAFRER